MPERTIEVVLVLVPHFPLLSMSICTESLRVANREAGRSAFNWVLATADGAPVRSSSGFDMSGRALGEIERADVAIVLSSYGPEAGCDPTLLNWLRRQDRLGGLIACADTAGYILARAGLLGERHIAVHPETLPAYQAIFEGRVILDSTAAEDGRILSSTGGMATMDMVLRLIHRLAEDGIAARVAEVMVYPWRPAEGPEAAPRTDVARRIDGRLGRMVELMQMHLDTPLPLEELCVLAHVPSATARRLFHRHFQRSPRRYYLDLRLRRARDLLRNSAIPVSDVAARSGFADQSAFTRAYQSHYAVLPSRDRVDKSGR